MTIIFAGILALCLYRINIAKASFFHVDYLDAKNTLSIKGLFTLLIFLSHFVTYIPMDKPLDAPYAAFRSYMGQAIVAPFLFLSGYGIFVSICSKKDYVRQMPLRRIGNTLFNMHAALLLFFIGRTIQGKRYTLLYLLKVLISWNSLGNSDWYIFSILMLYTITYVSFSVFGEKNKDAGLISAGILTVLFTLFMKHYKSPYWYNIDFAYWFGLLYARWKKELDECIMQNDRTWLLMIFAAGAGFFILQMYRGNLIAYESSAICFSLLVILASMKISMQNPLLIYCGKHLFSLFILQRLPMLFFNRTPASANVYVYFFTCLVVTFILSAGFDRFVPLIWKKIQPILENPFSRNEISS